MRRKLVLWFVLLIAGFLTGFILQYASLRRTQQQLCVSAEQLRSCRSRERLSQLRDTGTMMYLEALKKNWKGRGILEGTI
jgi:hypothetical protein